MAGQSGRPGVGIVSDTVLQRHRLQAATGKFGLEVSFSGDPSRLMDYPEFPDACLWLVTLEDEADHPALFDHLLENTDAPVLFGVDQAPKPGSTDYFRWERRLVDKLEQQLGHLETLDTASDLEELVETTPAPHSAPELPHWIAPAAPGSLAEDVWVLGASLGGPAAVKTFLDNLPPGLPVGFVYAQHIDGNFTEVLTRVLGRHAHYQLKRAEEGYRVRNGDVVLMPVEREWSFDTQGQLTERNTPWPGPYGPPNEAPNTQTSSAREPGDAGAIQRGSSGAVLDAGAVATNSSRSWAVSSSSRWPSCCSSLSTSRRSQRK